MLSTTDMDTIMIFMSDGESEYPSTSIKSIKDYIISTTFKSNGKKFEFFGIGFH